MPNRIIQIYGKANPKNIRHQEPCGWFGDFRKNDNRGEDGKALRELFIEENNLDDYKIQIRRFVDEPCTMFELLVGLARRLEFLMYDLNPKKDHTSKWFMELVKNLRLNRFNDNFSNFTDFDPVTEAEIDEILEVLIGRTYDYYGAGSLFPLKKRPPKDMTEVEIWYQMMLYLDENYGY